MHVELYTTFLWPATPLLARWDVGLVTPLRWRNTQLASPDWLPIDGQIEGWLGSDNPLYLEFRGATDWASPTDFSLDNARLVTTCQ